MVDSAWARPELIGPRISSASDSTDFFDRYRSQKGASRRQIRTRVGTPFFITLSRYRKNQLAPLRKTWPFCITFLRSRKPFYDACPVEANVPPDSVMGDRV